MLDQQDRPHCFQCGRRLTFGTVCHGEPWNHPEEPADALKLWHANGCPD